MAETGFELNISGLEESLNRIDRSIKSLATTTRNSTNKMIQSFNDIQKNGLGVFSQEIANLNTTLSNFGKNANISKSADDIVKLANALQQLTDKQKLQLKTEKKKVDYATQKNDLKEIAILEKERTRELERQNRINIYSGKKQEALQIKRITNATRELMNEERKRGRNLIEKDMENKLKHKENLIRLRQQIKEMERLAKAYKAMPANISTKNVGGLIGQSLNTKTINQRITAIHNLKTALKDLDTTTEKGQRTQVHLTNEIARQEKELQKLGINLDRVKEKKRTLINYADQLRRGLALVFSLSQIKNYIVQLVKIRAEFEMQQRSLEVLLQNKDEANKLWSQTVQLAVKSPFTVKQLVTYTKQLAAYRIESEKLFETNKMLADVSAGLGVDMQRLILAFGQVKAANYLRGTELRQFSEAGVNMLGELAKYYTELEGKVVSVGEVFNMISKRQVDFEDVAEIFKRITSEGGLFFQMQEKQSETTLGQWRNLIDSLHLMFNEIGKANDGVIKDFIKALRDIITNWQTISDVALPILSALIARWAVLKLSMLSFGKVNFITTLVPSLKAVAVQIRGLKLGFQQATKHARIFATSMGKGVSLAGGWATIISTVILVVYGLVNAIKLARGEFGKLSDAISNLGVEAKKDLLESIGQYRRLATTLTDVTKSYKEREDAMQSMKRIFSDILPQEMLEVENIRAMGSAYKDATDALKLHYATAAEERKKALVDEKIEPKLQDEISSLVESFSKVITYTGENGKRQKWMTEFGLDSEGVASIFGQVINDAKEGLVNIDKLKEELVTRLEKYYSVNLPDASKIQNKFFNEDIEDIQEYLRQRQELLNISVGAQFITKEQKEQFEASNEKRKAYEKEKEALDDLTAAYSTYFKLRKKGGTDAEIADAELDITNIYSNLGLSSPENIKEITADAWAIRDELGRVGEVIGRNFSASIADGIKNNPFLKNFQETVIDKDLEVFRGNKWTKSIDALVKNAAKEYKVELSELNDLIVKTNMGVDDFGKAVKSKYESVTEVVEKFNLATEGHGPITMQKRQELIDEAETRLQITEEEIKQYKKMIPMLEFIAKMIGISLSGKTTRGGSGQGKDWYLELAKGLQSVHKDFLTLNKDLDKTRAKELALEKNTEVLKTSLKQLGLDESFYKGVDFSSETSVIEVLEKIKNLPKITAKSKVEVEKLLADIKGEVELSIAIKDREAVERMFDDMFSNYEMTMELESEGLNADWFSNLLGDSFNKTSAQDIFKTIFKNIDYNAVVPEKILAKDLIGYINDSEIADENKKMLVKLVNDVNKAEMKALEKMAKESSKMLIENLDKRNQILKKYAIEEQRIKTEMTAAYSAAPEAEKSNVKALEKQLLDANKKKMTAELKKIEWDEFKGGETMLMLMNNLEVASKSLLENTIAQIERFKDEWTDMDFKDMKEVVDYLNKLNLALANIERAGQTRRRIRETEFEYEFEGGSKIEQKGLDGIDVSAVAEDVAKKADKLNELEKELNLYTQINHAIEHGNTAEANRLITENEIVAARTDENKITSEAIESKKEEIKNTEEQIENGLKIVNVDKQRQTALEKTSKNISTANKYTKELYNLFKGLSEVLTGGDGVGAIFADMGMQMLETVLNTIILQVQLKAATHAAHGMGAAMKSAMGPIGWIVMALELVVMGLTAIFRAHDKRLEKQIDNLKDKVDLLEKSYENLEKAIERATSTAAMKSNYDQAIRNLQAQADAYEKMAKLEEDKKKTDEEQLKEYQEKQQEALEKQRELLEEQVESFGATYVYRDVAEDFVNAWADAFAETGNGLSGLDSAWDDYFNNIMKNTIASAGVSKIMQKVIDKVNSSLEDDFEIDENEYRQIESLSNGAKAEIDAYLQKMAELYPEVFDGSGSGDTMSGLQRGIHELSESTGGIIAAYLDSLRFFVADNNTQLKQLINNFEPATITTPILAELKAQTELIRTIDDRLGSVIGRGDKAHIGAYIKVVTNL